MIQRKMNCAFSGLQIISLQSIHRGENAISKAKDVSKTFSNQSILMDGFGLELEIQDCRQPLIGVLQLFGVTLDRTLL
jgi:hypothetical protein